jgi:hypothetical protein
MNNVEFDGFGEPMLKSRVLPSEPQGRLSRWMVRAGTAVFWSLVVAIVLTRAVYFSPGFADKIAELSSDALLALSVLWV